MPAVRTGTSAFAPAPAAQEETPEAAEHRKAEARTRLETRKKAHRSLTAAAAWESAESARKQQNFKEAREAYETLALHHPEDEKALPSVEQAAFCAMRLGEYDDALQFVEDARELFRGTEREARGASPEAGSGPGRMYGGAQDVRREALLLRMLGNLYLAIPHFGTKKGGTLMRARYDQGIYQYTYKIDRDAAIARLEEARTLFKDHAERIEADLDLAGAVARFTPYDSSWSMWYYAWNEAQGDDLASEQGPDEQADSPYGGWQSAFYRAKPRGVPVDAQGNVIFTPRPKSYDRRLTDTAKIKFLLHEIVELDDAPNKKHAAEALYRQALFFLARDGAQRLQRLAAWWWEGSNPYKAAIEAKQIHELADDEVLGLIATHIGVYKVPDDENALRLFQRIAEEYPKTETAERARLSIGIFHQTRRQYDRALQAYEKYLTTYPNGQLRGEADSRIASLKAPEAKIDTSQAQAAGENAILKLEHRNVSRLFGRATPIDMAKFVALFEEQWKINGTSGNAWLYPSSPQHFFFQDEKRGRTLYRGPHRSFEIDVTDDGTYRYRTSEVRIPVKEEGMWLVEVYKDAEEKTQLSRALLVLETTAVVRKAGKDADLLWIVDARTGKPLAGADVHVFEYWDTWEKAAQQPTHHYQERDVKSGPDGIAYLKGLQQQYLVTVRAKDRFAYVSDAYRWGYSPSYAQEGTTALIFTDRPVYRPKDQVNLAAFARKKVKGRYVEAKPGERLDIQIYDPKGARVYQAQAVTSGAGSAAFTWAVPASAALGPYQIQLTADGVWTNVQGGSFRVEEYKAPELEVTVKASKGPAKLGEKIPVEVRADYFFGGPVAGAKVKYKVFRQEWDEVFVSPGRWDWLYGAGYGRAYYAYPWFAWWGEWGWRPWVWYPWWGPRHEEAKELIREAEGVLDEKGALSFEIDTQGAKASFGDRDQRFFVQADVTDSSRRTISGSGEVLATRHQFFIHAETERGYYETGNTIHLEVTSLLPGKEPIATEGEVRIALVSLRGDNGDTLEEAPLLIKKAGTDAGGRLEFAFDAQKEGQYRLSYVAKDAWGEEVVGTTLVWVWGPDFTGRRFKFNHLEVVSDKRTYKVGDTAKLLVSSDIADAHVLFSSKVDNGHLLEAKVIALSGKTKVVPIVIEAGHVPNFFVEATLVGGGRISEEVREMFVPPEHADMKVEIRPKKREYRAGKEAEIEIITTDQAGKPISADVALSVFDKSVLYIQPELTPDVRKTFWGATRTHAIVSDTNLKRRYDTWQSLSYPDQQAAWWFNGAENAVLQGQLDLSGLSDDKQKSSIRGAAVAETRSDGELARDAAGPSAHSGAPQEQADRLTAAVAQGTAGKKDSNFKALEKAPDPQATTVEPEVRRSFADTALWRFAKTDAEGRATIAFKFPDNLTTWRAKAVGLSADTRAGEDATSIITTQKLLVRLEAPRFFRERDRLVLSAIVHNRLAGDKQVKVAIDVTDSLLHLEGPPSKDVLVPKDGEARVDFWVRVSGEGTAKVKVSALTDEESDAKEMSFPVLVHGFLKTDSQVGSISARASDPAEKTVAFSVPKERRADQGELVVRWSPTLAGAMIDALPYLLEYPYGCTEQTMSRFFPAVVTRRTLQMAGGLSLEQLEKIQRSLNPQELTEDPRGADEHRARLEHDFKRFERNPVYDTKLMDDMIATGPARIERMQRPGGGWGWWSSDRGDVYTTSYVLFGLAEARAADVSMPGGMVERGLAAMESMIQGHIEDYKKHEWVSDTDAYFAYVMSLYQRQNETLNKYLFERRDKLTVYGKSLLALALFNLKHEDDARLVLRNAEQFLKEDRENETAWLETNERWWWWWWNDDIESNAFFLRALVTIKPQDAHAPMIVKWLLNHRKHGYYWNSTRDTAVAISAFAHYLRATKETEPDYDLEIALDGKALKTVHIDRSNFLTFDGEIRIPAKDLTSGDHRLTVKRKGKGPVYFNTYLSYFTLEEDVPPAGLEIKVERKYSKLVRENRVHDGYDQRGGSVAITEGAYKKVPLKSGDNVKSGDLILVELSIESKNDYAFLAFEDPKPAGMEPVALRSGVTYGEAVANLELRDEKVVFFLSTLRQGKLLLEYRLRAEIPGEFHAMPTLGFAMYAPELKANASEMRVTIGE